MLILYRPLLLSLSLLSCCTSLFASVDTSNADSHDMHTPSFNPNMTLILGGNYHHTSGSFNPTGLTHLGPNDDADSHDDHTAHPSTDNGFNLDDSLISFSAAIDPSSEGYLAIAFNDQEAYVDEAYARFHISAPLTLMAGRLRSQISPRNLEHHHLWNLADMSLPYQAFLGHHGLIDDGMSVLWQPLDSSLQTGLELFQGKQQTILGVQNNQSSPNLMTAFTRMTVKPNLQLGAWAAYAHHNEQQLSSGHGGHSHVYSLTSRQTVYGIQTIHRSNKLMFSTELLQATSHFIDAKRIRDTGPQIINANHLHRFGYAIETTYDLTPHWQVAGRIDGLTRQRYVFSDHHQFDVGASLRSSLAINFHPTSTSRLRGQVDYGLNRAIDDSVSTHGTTWLISYNISLGHAHHNSSTF